MVQLSPKEVQVLIEYNKYLQFLIDKHEPDDTLRMYNYFVDKAGFVEGSDLFTEKISLELDSNREMIIQSYQDAKKLVKIVGQVIQKYKKA